MDETCILKQAMAKELWVYRERDGESHKWDCNRLISNPWSEEEKGEDGGGGGGDDDDC
jgi:hypothetical protein